MHAQRQLETSLFTKITSTTTTKNRENDRPDGIFMFVQCVRERFMLFKVRESRREAMDRSVAIGE